MVDRLCWKHYGHVSGTVEQVLEANPHLADQGPYLSAGYVLTLPDINVSTVTEKVIRLWD